MCNRTIKYTKILTIHFIAALCRFPRDIPSTMTALGGVEVVLDTHDPFQESMETLSNLRCWTNSIDVNCMLRISHVFKHETDT